MKDSLLLLFLAIFVSVFNAIEVHSQISPLFSYQGQFLDETNKPLKDGSYQIKFKIYDSPDSQSHLWEEVITTNIVNGYCNVYLGEKSSLLSLNFNTELFLGITLDNSIEYTPRTKFAAVPLSLYSFSILAENAKEGNVYSIKNGKPSWNVSGSTAVFPITGEANTDDAAMSILQKGQGDALSLTRTFQTGKIKDKNINNNLQSDEIDVVRFLTSYDNTFETEGYAGYMLVNNPNAKKPIFYIKNVGGQRQTLFVENTNTSTTDYSMVNFTNHSLSNALVIYQKNPYSEIPAVAILSESKAGALTLKNTVIGETPVLNVASSSNAITSKFSSEILSSKNPILQIESNHSGAGVLVKIENNNNDSTGILVNNYGKGSSGRFFTYNTSNANVAVLGNTYGTGRAGQFVNMATNNSQSALAGITLGNGTAISGYSPSSSANAGVFYLDNKSNTQSSLYSLTDGSGYAGEFIVNNPQNSMAAVAGYTLGSGPAIYGKSDGIGRVASFEQKNASALQPALYVSTSASQPGVYARNDGSGSVAQFYIPSGSNRSILLIADNQAGGTAAHFQSTNNTDDPAVIITKNGVNKYAAQIIGNVKIMGNLEKSSGSFVIDHPLDPENKLLVHSFVESPDMKNIYDGVAICNELGEAKVILPDWFEALNKDFRYQLTCIGSFANIYIKEEINNNSFAIAGGKLGLKVSWQVTGIRKDAYAEKYRIQVEREKPNQEKGTYLHPELFDKSTNQNEINNNETGTKQFNDIECKKNENTEVIENIKKY